MNRIQINAFLRRDFIKKDGTYPICLRVQKGNSKKVYSLNVSCKLAFWDKTRQEIKPGPSTFVTDNNTINTAKESARELITRGNLERKELTLHDFSHLFSSKQARSDSFLEFWQNELIQFKSSYSSETQRTNKSQLEKLKRFRTEVQFDDLTVFFWKQYDNWLKEKGNSINTRHKAFRTLKAYINKAIQAGFMKENPLKGHKVKQVQGKREYLTVEELSKLEAIFYTEKLSKSQRIILSYFLFSCYTGIRYRDINELKHINIKEKEIDFVMQKTSHHLTVPLMDKSRRFLKPGLPSEKLFRVYCNQVTNRELKVIMEKAEINKWISFHCARHTFATVCLSELNIPITVIQKLLGHTELRHTLIYAKVLDKNLRESMQKWNDL